MIDNELFNRVQERIESNRYAPAKYKARVKYLLSGKLYCGKCDMGMIGEYGTSRSGDKHYYYTCSTRKKTKVCDKKSVPKEWLENLVVAETVKNILQPERMNVIAKRCVEIHQKESVENNELLYLQKQLSETKKLIANLLAAIEQGIITKTTKTRLAELEAAQEKLEFEIDICKIKQPELTENHVIYMLSQFQRETPDELEKYNEDIIDCFVNSVYLYDDKLFITYNLTNEKSDLLRSDLETLPDTIDNIVLSGSDLEPVHCL